MSTAALPADSSGVRADERGPVGADCTHCGAPGWGMKLWGNGYLCPWCEYRAARGKKTDAEPDTDTANPRSEPDNSDSTAVTSKEIARHYEKTIQTYRELGELPNGAVALAVPDNRGWYYSPGATTSTRALGSSKNTTAHIVTRGCLSTGRTP